MATVRDTEAHGDMHAVTLLVVLGLLLGDSRGKGLRDNSAEVVAKKRDELLAYEDLFHASAFIGGGGRGRPAGMHSFLQRSHPPPHCMRIDTRKGRREHCLIIKFGDSTDSATLERIRGLLHAIDGTLRTELTALFRGHIVCFPLPSPQAEGVEEGGAPISLLRSLLHVSIIEQDAPISVDQWATDRITPAPLRQKTALRRIVRHAEEVNVYVVDTGIWTQHGEFGPARASIGFSLFGGRFGDDCNGHGTQVASLIGGRTLGVAPNARLIGVQAIDCDGLGNVGNVLIALEWIRKNAVKPAVVNMSFSGSRSVLLDEAVAGLIAYGIPVVAAAGNRGCDACDRSPSDASQAIIVGAIDNNDRRAAWSNYGPCVTLFAPGCDITAASVPFTPKMFGMRGGAGVVYENAVHPQDRYVVTSGTSFAAPLVAGSLALLLATNRTMAPEDLRRRLLGVSESNVLHADSLNNSPNILLQLPC